MAFSSSKISGDFYNCQICSKRCKRTEIDSRCSFEQLHCNKCRNQDMQLLIPRPKCEIGLSLSQPTVLSKCKKMFGDLKNVTKETCTPKPSYRNLPCRDNSMTLSKKPVHCPYVRCSKTIAISSVYSHFKYEHKYVPVLSTAFGARSELELDPYTLEINQPTCIVLITFPEKPESVSALDEGSINPTMLLMASNIMNNQLTRAKFVDDGNRSEESLSYAPFDKIIFWICSNIITQSKCTLAVSTICKSIRIKYYGAITQINDSYIKLCQEGKGLIMHQMQILNMTNYGKKRLAVDVIIHKEEKDV